MSFAQGHTIGRLLLHGLQGEARERERINLNGVADRAEKSQTARNTNLVVHPANKHIQFDGKALAPCGVHGLARSIGKAAWPLPAVQRSSPSNCALPWSRFSQ